MVMGYLVEWGVRRVVVGGLVWRWRTRKSWDGYTWFRYGVGTGCECVVEVLGWLCVRMCISVRVGLCVWVVRFVCLPDVRMMAVIKWLRLYLMRAGILVVVWFFHSLANACGVKAREKNIRD